MWASKQENSLFLYLRSRAEMHTRRERVSIGRLSNEGACNESEAGQRPPEMSRARRAQWRDASHSRETVPRPPAPIFVYLWPITLFLSHTWLVHGPPQDACTTFLLKWIPSQRAMGVWPHLLWGWVPSLFNPQEAPLHTGRQGRLPWPQEWASYLFALAELSFCH